MWAQNAKQQTKKKIKKPTLRQEMVLRAIQKLQPCHYRQISGHLSVIEGRVTPRIAELRRKGYVDIAYINKGLDGVRVNYYRVTAKGLRFLRDEDTEFEAGDVS